MNFQPIDAIPGSGKVTALLIMRSQSQSCHVMSALESFWSQDKVVVYLQGQGQAPPKPIESEAKDRFANCSHSSEHLKPHLVLGVL